jgi:hypothetical protein
MEIILVESEAIILNWLHDRAEEYSKKSMFARSEIIEKTELSEGQFNKAISFLVHHQLIGTESLNMKDTVPDLGIWITADGANVLRHFRRKRGEHT